MSKENRLITWIILLLLSIIWGSSFILIKRGLLIYSPGEVGAIRVISAALILTPFAVRKLSLARSKNFWNLLAVGMAGSFLPAFLFAKAQTQIDSSIAGVLNALTPFFVLLIGLLVYKQAIAKKVVLGIVIGLLGTIVLIFTGSEGSLSSLNFYAFYIVVATLCYGINVNLIKYRISNLNAVTITSLAMFLTLPFALIYLFSATDFLGKTSAEPLAFEALGYIALLGIMSTAIALILFNYLIKISTPIFASSVTYMIPVVAVAWGLIDGEVLFITHIIGMMAILGGVYLVNDV